MISGGEYGVKVASGASTVDNAGTIRATKYDGIYLERGGVISNTVTTALITGGRDGILMSLGYGSVVNAGTIYGGSIAGILAEYGAVISNTGSAANISGKNNAVELKFSPGTVLNQGTINGASGSGVYLAAGGKLNNETLTARIFGGQYGVRAITGAATVLNSGSIFSNSNGVSLGLGGYVANISTASMIIGRSGIVVNGAPGTVVNAGTVSGAYFLGIELVSGGQISNTNTASLIYSTEQAVFDTGATTLFNAGTILAVNYDAVYIKGGGAVTNSGTAALISGGQVGVKILGAAGSVQNNGTIKGSGNYSNGVYLYAGSVTNSSAAAIISGGYNGVVIRNTGAMVVNEGAIAAGRFDGVDLKAGGTLLNAGTISGGKFAAYLNGTSNSRLILDAGAVFIGTVAASGTYNVLELASTTSAGTLHGLGGTINGFQTISFDAGATWLVSGSLAGLQGETITGFGASDTLVLDGFTASSESFSNGTLSLTDGIHNEALVFEGNLSLASFHVTDTNAGTQIALCYLRGTEILTPHGPRAVEDLRIGDAVVTRFSAVQPVKWIGKQVYAAPFLRQHRARYPVYIQAGALGQSVPRQGLFVSPGHSMLVNGTLLLAKNLVNGISVRQDVLPELVEYFAIELSAHDCVLAHGAWGESFADGPGLRRQFHNLAEFQALFPDYEEPAALQLCAPRPEAGPELEAALAPVLAPVLARAEATPGALHGYIERLGPDCIEGWAWDAANPDLPVALEIFAGAEKLVEALACHYRGDIAQAGFGRGHCMFSFAIAGDWRAELIVRRKADGAQLPRAARMAA